MQQMKAHDSPTTSLHYHSRRQFTLPPLQRLCKRTTAARENGIELGGSKAQNRTWEFQHRAQTIRHIIRRQLIEQAEDILTVGTQLPVGNSAAKAKLVKVPNSDVASEEDRMRTVQRYYLSDNIRDGVGVRATEPLYTRGIGVDGDVLCVVELDDAIDVRVGCAVKGAYVDEGWRSVRSVRWEEFVQE